VTDTPYGEVNEYDEELETDEAESAPTVVTEIIRPEPQGFKC
jgi:hypothetical protein